MAEPATTPKILSVAWVLALAAADITGAAAQPAPADPAATYPNRLVRLLMGPAAGGPTDGVGRVLAARLSEIWGRTVVVENRPGASNTIATHLAARASPDGYTLLLCPLSDAVVPAVFENIPYNLLRDIAAISKIGTTANLFVVHPSLPVKSVPDFIALAKRRPGQLNYGAQGTGQAGHVSMEWLKQAANIEVVYVPYKSAPYLTMDLLTGTIQAQITNLPSHIETIRTGKLRALGVTTPKRDPRLPDVPAIAETETLKGYDVTTWYGICAPAGMPQRIESKLSADVAQALNTPNVQARLYESGVNVESSTPEEFTAFIKAEVDRWKTVIEKIGIPKQKLN